MADPSPSLTQNGSLPPTLGDAVAGPQTTQRLGVTELPPRVAAMRQRLPQPSMEAAQWIAAAQQTPILPQPEPQPTRAIEAVLQLAGYAVSARALLLLALIAAFILAVMAMMTETMIRVYVLIAYSVLVVLPIVGLEIRKR